MKNGFFACHQHCFQNFLNGQSNPKTISLPPAKLKSHDYAKAVLAIISLVALKRFAAKFPAVLLKEKWA
jgi:hypothetical protein